MNSEIESILSNLRIKLLNFDYKYKVFPQIIVLNPAHLINEQRIYETVFAYMPYVPMIKVIYSPRVSIGDFEVF